METSFTPQIVAADRLSHGLVIKFETGQCAFYSDTLLFSRLEECGELDENEIEW